MNESLLQLILTQKTITCNNSLGYINEMVFEICFKITSGFGRVSGDIGKSKLATYKSLLKLDYVYIQFIILFSQLLYIFGNFCNTKFKAKIIV